LHKRVITGSIQIKNGKYWAVINLYNENNIRKPKWIDTGLPEKGNKRKADKFLADCLSEYNKHNVPYSKITVAQYFEQWLDQIKPPEIKQNTYRSYCGNMRNHIIPYFEQNKILLQELTAIDLELYYKSKLQANSKLKSMEALSPVTIKHHHQNISKALTDAIRAGLITTNPASVARTPKAERYKAKYLNSKEVDSMLKLFSGNVIELPVTLCAVYGLRRSEVLGVKWYNVDFEMRTIRIAETLQQHTGGDYTDTPKTDSSYRTLPMTDTVYKLLQAHKKLQDERKQIMGNYYVQNDYVCTWANGKVITPNYLTKTFHSVISKSTLPQIRLHDLRHSVASNLLDKGFSVVQVQEWLGHGSAATTLNFYAHADKRSKLEIASALQSMFSESNC